MVRTILVAAVLGTAVGAWAQNDAGAEDAGPDVSLSLRGGLGYTFGTDVDGGAEVSVLRAGGGGAIEWGAAPELRLRFNADYELSEYAFDRLSSVIPAISSGDPFDGFHSLGLGLSGTYIFDETWSMTLGGLARGGWEAGADVGDAWAGGGFGSVNIRVNEGLTIGFGVGAMTQLEDDPFVFPVAVVHWQIAEGLRLDSERLGARLAWTFDDAWDVFGRAGYEKRQYRLEDGHALIGEGVLRDTRVEVGAGVRWRPLEGMTVGLEVGAAVYTELEFWTDGGSEVADPGADPAPYIAVTLRYTF